MERFGKAGLALCTVVAASLPAKSSHGIAFEGEAENTRACPAYHVVERGETLWDIAREHYGLVAIRSNYGRIILHHPTEIASKNGLSPHDLIRPGQRLMLPSIYVPCDS